LEKAFPFKVDLMVGLYDAFLVLAGWVKQATGVVERIAKQTQSGLGVWGIMSSAVMKLYQGLSSSFIGGLNSVVKIVGNALGNWSGVAVAALVAGKAIGSIIGANLVSLTKIDWGALLVSAIKVIPAAFIALMGVITGVLIGLFEQLGPAFSAAVGNIMATVQEAFASGLVAIVPALTELVGAIGEAAKSTFSEVGQQAVGAWNSLLSAVSSVWDNLKSQVTSAVQNFGNDVINGIKSALSSAIPTFSAPTAAPTPAPTPAAPTPAAPAPTPTASTPTAFVPSAGNGAAAWRGWLPSPVTQQLLSSSSPVKTAAGGLNFSGLVSHALKVGVPVTNLLTAAVVERRNAPTSANLVVANTSETILTQSQARKVGVAYQGSGKVAPSFGPITINISGINDPQAVARQVIAELDSLVQQAEMKLRGI